MKHTIHLNWPRFFGKKKAEEAEVTTDINLVNADKYILIGGALVIGMALGYAIGHNRGASKMLQRVLIIK
jgi:hypothetical protein